MQCIAQALLAQRDELLGMQDGHGQQLYERATDLSMAAVEGSIGAAEARTVKGQVADYIRCGSLAADAGGGGLGGALTAPNPTFLLAPELQYTVSLENRSTR